MHKGDAPKMVMLGLSCPSSLNSESTATRAEEDRMQNLTTHQQLQWNQLVGSIWNTSHCIKLNVADGDTKWEELTEGVIGVRVVGIALHSRPLPHHTVPADDTVQHAAVLLGGEGRGGEGRMFH